MTTANLSVGIKTEKAKSSLQQLRDSMAKGLEGLKVTISVEDSIKKLVTVMEKTELKVKVKAEKKPLVDSIQAAIREAFGQSTSSVVKSTVQVDKSEADRALQSLTAQKPMMTVEMSVKRNELSDNSSELNGMLKRAEKKLASGVYVDPKVHPDSDFDTGKNAEVNKARLESFVSRTKERIKATQDEIANLTAQAPKEAMAQARGTSMGKLEVPVSLKLEQVSLDEIHSKISKHLSEAGTHEVKVSPSGLDAAIRSILREPYRISFDLTGLRAGVTEEVKKSAIAPAQAQASPQVSDQERAKADIDKISSYVKTLRSKQANAGDVEAEEIQEKIDKALRLQNSKRAALMAQTGAMPAELAPAVPQVAEPKASGRLHEQVAGTLAEHYELGIDRPKLQEAVAGVLSHQYVLGLNVEDLASKVKEAVKVAGPVMVVAPSTPREPKPAEPLSVASVVRGKPDVIEGTKTSVTLSDGQTHQLQRMNSTESMGLPGWHNVTNDPSLHKTHNDSEYRSSYLGDTKEEAVKNLLQRAEADRKQAAPPAAPAAILPPTPPVSSVQEGVERLKAAMAGASEQAHAPVGAPLAHTPEHTPVAESGQLAVAIESLRGAVLQMATAQRDAILAKPPAPAKDESSRYTQSRSTKLDDGSTVREVIAKKPADALPVLDAGVARDLSLKEQKDYARELRDHLTAAGNAAKEMAKAGGLNSRGQSSAKLEAMINEVNSGKLTSNMEAIVNNRPADEVVREHLKMAPTADVGRIIERGYAQQPEADLAKYKNQANSLELAQQKKEEAASRAAQIYSLKADIADSFNRPVKEARLNKETASIESAAEAERNRNWGAYQGSIPQAPNQKEAWAAIERDRRAQEAIDKASRAKMEEEQLAAAEAAGLLPKQRQAFDKKVSTEVALYESETQRLGELNKAQESATKQSKALSAMALDRELTAAGNTAARQAKLDGMNSNGQFASKASAQVEAIRSGNLSDRAKQALGDRPAEDVVASRLKVTDGASLQSLIDQSERLSRANGPAVDSYRLMRQELAAIGNLASKNAALEGMGAQGQMAVKAQAQLDALQGGRLSSTAQRAVGSKKHEAIVSENLNLPADTNLRKFIDDRLALLRQAVASTSEIERNVLKASTYSTGNGAETELQKLTFQLREIRKAQDLVNQGETGLAIKKFTQEVVNDIPRITEMTEKLKQLRLEADSAGGGSKALSMKMGRTYEEAKFKAQDRYTPRGAQEMGVQALLAEHSEGDVRSFLGKKSFLVDERVNPGDHTKPLKESGNAAAESREKMLQWRNAANDAHSAARGLAGSLDMLWVTWGSTAPIVAAAAIGAAIRGVYEEGKKVEYQLAFVKGLSGESVAPKTFESAVEGSMYGTKEAADGLRALTQSGLSAKESIAALPDVLSLATVGEMSVAEAAYAATGIYKAFGLALADLPRVSDVIAKAAAESNASVVDIMQSMKYASAASSLYGETLEQTAAATAVLSEKNIKGSMAGTAHMNMLREIYTPTKKASEAFKQLGIDVQEMQRKGMTSTQMLGEIQKKASKLSSTDLRAFTADVGGERGNRELAPMMELGTKNVVDMEKKLKDAGGFTQLVMAELQNTVEGSQKRLSQSISFALANAFDEAKGPIQQFNDYLADAFRSDSFKVFIHDLTEGMLSLTTFIREHAEAIKLVAEAYLAWKVIGGVSALLDRMTSSMLLLTEAQGVHLAQQPVWMRNSAIKLGMITKENMAVSEATVAVRARAAADIAAAEASAVAATATAAGAAAGRAANVATAEGSIVDSAAAMAKRGLTVATGGLSGALAVGAGALRLFMGPLTLVATLGTALYTVYEMLTTKTGEAAKAQDEYSNSVRNASLALSQNEDRLRKKVELLREEEEQYKRNGKYTEKTEEQRTIDHTINSSTRRITAIEGAMLQGYSQDTYDIPDAEGKMQKVSKMDAIELLKQVPQMKADRQKNIALAASSDSYRSEGDALEGRKVLREFIDKAIEGYSDRLQGDKAMKPADRDKLNRAIKDLQSHKAPEFLETVANTKDAEKYKKYIQTDIIDPSATSNYVSRTAGADKKDAKAILRYQEKINIEERKLQELKDKGSSESLQSQADMGAITPVGYYSARSKGIDDNASKLIGLIDEDEKQIGNKVNQYLKASYTTVMDRMSEGGRKGQDPMEILGQFVRPGADLVATDIMPELEKITGLKADRENVKQGASKSRVEMRRNTSGMIDKEVKGADDNLKEKEEVYKAAYKTGEMTLDGYLKRREALLRDHEKTATKLLKGEQDLIQQQVMSQTDMTPQDLMAKVKAGGEKGVDAATTIAGVMRPDATGTPQEVEASLAAWVQTNKKVDDVARDTRRGLVDLQSEAASHRDSFMQQSMDHLQAQVSRDVLDIQKMSMEVEAHRSALGDMREGPGVKQTLFPQEFVSSASRAGLTAAQSAAVMNGRDSAKRSNFENRQELAASGGARLHGRVQHDKSIREAMKAYDDYAPMIQKVDEELTKENYTLDVKKRKLYDASEAAQEANSIEVEGARAELAETERRVSSLNDLKIAMEGSMELSATSRRKESLKLSEEERSATAGMRKFWDSYSDAALDNARIVENILGQTFGSLETGLTKALEGGKFKFKDFTRSVMADAARMMASAAIKKMLNTGISLVAGLFGGGGGTVAGGAPGLGGLDSSTLSVVKSANGNVMTSAGPMQLNAFARGGIARKPMVSLVGEGSMAEAYVPLPDGRSIPVTLAGGDSGGGGGGGGNVSSSINVYVQSDGSAKVESQPSNNDAADLGRKIEQAVVAVIIKEQRPGGVLYK